MNVYYGLLCLLYCANDDYVYDATYIKTTVLDGVSDGVNVDDDV